MACRRQQQAVSQRIVVGAAESWNTIIYQRGTLTCPIMVASVLSIAWMSGCASSPE